MNLLVNLITRIIYRLFWVLGAYTAMGLLANLVTLIGNAVERFICRRTTDTPQERDQ